MIDPEAWLDAVLLVKIENTKIHDWCWPTYLSWYMDSQPAINRPKALVEHAKLGTAYSLYITSILLQLQDPETVWTPQKIIGNIIVFFSMILMKLYGVSHCECEVKPANEPIVN